MDIKKRSAIALALLSWASISMYMVWYTQYEILGVGGFLVLAALKVLIQKPTLGGAQ